jgi:hypothetical protein
MGIRRITTVAPLLALVVLPATALACSSGVKNLDLRPVVFAILAPTRGLTPLKLIWLRRALPASGRWLLAWGSLLFAKLAGWGAVYVCALASPFAVLSPIGYAIGHAAVAAPILESYGARRAVGTAIAMSITIPAVHLLAAMAIIALADKHLITF